MQYDVHVSESNATDQGQAVEVRSTHCSPGGGRCRVGVVAVLVVEVVVVVDRSVDRSVGNK